MIRKATKWEKHFLEKALHTAQCSKDPSTKVGAVIIDKYRRTRGEGYNGFPRGVLDHESRYHEREVKYQMVVHAELNAILNARANVEGCTLYSTFFPCPQCTAAIIQSGIHNIIALANPSDARYIDKRLISEQMLIEATVPWEIVEL